MEIYWGGGIETEKSRDDFCTCLISILIPTIVYMLFGTAIPGFLELFYTCIFGGLFSIVLYRSFPENEDWIYRKFGTRESANILIIICWQCWINCSLLEKACEYHSTVFGRKEMQL